MKDKLSWGRGSWFNFVFVPMWVNSFLFFLTVLQMIKWFEFRSPEVWNLQIECIFSGD